jgi:DNA-binding transcriptional LysR family regulator
MITSEELSGPVRLTTTYALAEGFLIDRLGGLRERYPGIDLELVTDARIISLARREVDIALRLEPPKDRTLVSRHVATISFGLYASPAYRDKIVSGQRASFIGYDRDSDFKFEAAWLTRQFPGGRVAFRADGQMSQAAAARAGYGLALLPRYLVASDRELVQVTHAEPLPSRHVWLVIARGLAEVPKIRAVADYLIEILDRDRQLLANG